MALYMWEVDPGAQVYLARKRETGEVCALKKMRKRTLAKMDEVRRTGPQSGATSRCADSPRPRRARYPDRHQDGMARQAAVRLPGPDARLPRNGAWSLVTVT
jgi:hypothetical protein